MKAYSLAGKKKDEQDLGSVDLNHASTPKKQMLGVGRASKEKKHDSLMCCDLKGVQIHGTMCASP